MRILTVRQPWAWAIIHGGKDVENRVRNIAGEYRGPIAIHAGLRLDEAGLADWMVRRAITPDTLVNDLYIVGNIVGVVDLVGVHHEGEGSCGDSVELCSDWAQAGAHHLQLANPRALDEPLPWKGGLGLRRTNLFISGDWLGEHIDPGHSACTPYGCPPSCSSEPLARLVSTS